MILQKEMPLLPLSPLRFTSPPHQCRLSPRRPTTESRALTISRCAFGRRGQRSRDAGGRLFRGTLGWRRRRHRNSRGRRSRCAGASRSTGGRRSRRTGARRSRSIDGSVVPIGPRPEWPAATPGAGYSARVVRRFPVLRRLWSALLASPRPRLSPRSCGRGRTTPASATTASAVAKAQRSDKHFECKPENKIKVK